MAGGSWLRSNSGLSQGAWEDEDGAAAEGMLDKRGYWNPAWKARFFVLTPRGELEYYKAPDGAPRGAPAGVIPVALRAGCSGEAEETVVRAGGGRVIELTVRMAGPARGRTFVLRAETVADQERWVRVLRLVAEMWREEEPRRGSLGLRRSISSSLSRFSSAAALSPSPSPSLSSSQMVLHPP